MHNNSQNSDSEHDVSVEESYLRNFVNQMLKGRIFVGTYTEKQYVEQLNNYRDIVFIRNTEVDLIKSITIILNRIANKYNNRWIGITKHNLSLNLWVELENPVVGMHWYTIKRIKFRNNEILLQIKQSHPVEELHDNVETEENEFNLSGAAELCLEKLVKAANNLWIVLSYENIKSTVIFLFIILIAAITFIGNATKFLIENSLRLMREISIFIKSVTPIVQSCIALVERVIGWFFILIAMIWRDFKNPPHPQRDHNPNMLQYNNFHQPKMLGYQRRSGVVITEVID